MAKKAKTAKAEPDLLTLAEYFETKNPPIAQDIGEMLLTRSWRNGEEVKFSRKQISLLKRVRNECGACVACHAAEHLGCEPKMQSLSRVGGVNQQQLRWRAAESDVEMPSHVMMFDFSDGVRAIYDILEKGRDFKNWLTGRRIESLGCKTITAAYLGDRCGAPENCFGSEEWPADILPQAVLRRAHELNFA